MIFFFLLDITVVNMLIIYLAECKKSYKNQLAIWNSRWNYVRHLLKLGNLGEIHSLLGLEIFIILYSWSCKSLVWYIMVRGWSTWLSQRYIARDVITSICFSKKSTINHTIKSSVTSRWKKINPLPSLFLESHVVTYLRSFLPYSKSLNKIHINWNVFINNVHVFKGILFVCS